GASHAGDWPWTGPPRRRAGGGGTHGGRARPKAVFRELRRRGGSRRAVLRWPAELFSARCAEERG
ncbi:hypothetical protein, partial [Actinoalloteichus spitiensis]|uniref:hypothetical protein n=1 Tax=Actinoalloteichus spitiensis TaxID=252394 RepID=UPI001B7F96B3